MSSPLAVTGLFQGQLIIQTNDYIENQQIKAAQNINENYIQSSVLKFHFLNPTNLIEHPSKELDDMIKDNEIPVVLIKDTNGQLYNGCNNLAEIVTWTHQHTKLLYAYVEVLRDENYAKLNSNSAQIDINGYKSDSFISPLDSNYTGNLSNLIKTLPNLGFDGVILANCRYASELYGYEKFTRFILQV